MLCDSSSEREAAAMSLSGVWMAFSVDAELDCAACDARPSAIDTFWLGVCWLVVRRPLPLLMILPSPVR